MAPSRWRSTGSAQSSSAKASGADIAAHEVEQVRPGSIVLLYTMYRSRDASREALPALIDGLRARGLRFVTVSMLMALQT